MLELRRMNENDFGQIEFWLRKEHVRKWYEIPDMGITIEDWMLEIKGYQEDFCWITYLIALWNQQPIGMCLYYKCEDSTTEDFGVLPIMGSYGIDYLIGEETLIGKGLGKKMIKLLTDMVFSLPDAQRITADIDICNTASREVLRSCGFTLMEGEAHRYILRRADNTEKEKIENMQSTG